jgi:ABC-2 type transport system permease protein
MSGVSRLGAVARASAIVGIEDVKGFYTPKTWLLGWLQRVLFQVSLYALVGRYLGSPDQMAFLLVGSAASIALLESMTIVLFSAFDRQFGMLPLLVASPGDYFVVALARNINCAVTGTVTATVALFVCGPVVGVPLPWPQVLLVVPLLALGSVSAYLFGTLLGAIVAKTVQGRWLVFNVGYLAIQAFCGFLVPLGAWPAPVDAVARIMPFTHALEAIRGVLGGASAGTVLAQCGIEAAVAVGWFFAARAVFAASVALARRDGSINFGA